MPALDFEGHDAPCEGPDPRVSLLPLRREKVPCGRHFHGLGSHLRELLVPRETRSLGSDHSALDCLSFAARSSRRDHGGLHQFTSFDHAWSGRCREFTASAVPSLHLAL